MPTEIDSLQIQVTASAQKANDAIDRLVVKLDRLSTSLGGLKTGNLNGLANGVDRLGRAMQTMNTVKTADFTRLANNLAKLGNINVSALNSTASSLSHLTRAFNTLGGVSFDNKNLQNLINSITRLSNSNVQNLANIDFSRLGISINQLATSLSNAPKIQQSVISMTNAIANLSKSGQNIPIVASSLGSLGQSMNTFMASVSSAPNVSDNVISFAQAIGLLANSGTKAGITAKNLSSLGIGLRNLMATLSKAPQVSSNVIQMTNALANLASQGSKVGTASRSIQRGLNTASSSATRASKSFGGLASAIGKFYATYFIAIRGMKKLWSSIESSMDYVETLNYFNAAFEQVAQKADLSSFEELGYASAEEYAQSFSERAQQLTTKMTGFTISESGMLQSADTPSLGINPNQLMQYQAMFGQMASSMGITSENALKLSDALTMIGADLASVKNMDFDKVWTDMASGLAGMSRTLDKYGVNIRLVNLQEKLHELGINANIQALNQNDKALLRTIILLDSTRYAWGDLASTINQPANQLRLLKANFDNLSRTIANLFLPIVAKVLPYINGLVIALQRLAEWLVNLLGFGDFDFGGGTGSSPVEDLIGDIGDVGDGIDDATDSAKKLNKQLQKFDELNVITTPTSGGEDEDFSMGGGAGLLDAAFQDALDEYKKAWDEAFAEMENRANEFADKIEKFFEPIKKLFKDIAIGDWFAVGEDVSNIVSGIFDFFSKAIENVDWNAIGESIGKFLDGINWKRVFISSGNFFEKAIDSALELWKGSFKTAPIETGIISGLALLKLSGAGKILWEKISGSFSATVLGKSIGFAPTVAVSAVTFVIGFDVGKELGKALFPEDAKFYDEFSFFGEGGLFPTALDDIGTSFDAIVAMATDFTNNPIIAGITNFLAGPLLRAAIWITHGKETIEANLQSISDKFTQFQENGGLQGWFEGGVAPYFKSEIWAELWNNVKTTFETKWKEIEKWWNTSAIKKWYDEYVKPIFDKNNWSFDGIKEGLKTSWENAVEAVKEIWNKFAEWFNEKLSFEIQPIEVFGKTIFEGGEFEIGKLPTFATGGFPDSYSIFMAGENGIPELMGTVGGRTAVAGGAEITGIADAVYSTGQTEASLLRVAVGLLEVIAEKDFGVTEEQVYSAYRNQEIQYQDRTRRPGWQF